MQLSFLKKAMTLGKKDETDFGVFWWDERLKEGVGCYGAACESGEKILEKKKGGNEMCITLHAFYIFVQHVKYIHGQNKTVRVIMWQVDPSIIFCCYPRLRKNRGNFSVANSRFFGSVKSNVGISRGPFSYLTQLLVKGEGRLRKLNATSQMSI